MLKRFTTCLAVLLLAGAPLHADQLYLPNLGFNATGTTSGAKHLLDVNVAGGTISFTEGATAANGGALPATTKVVSGYDGSAVRVIKTDSGGAVQVDVESSALPTGAATAANQTTGNSSLSSIDGKITAVNTGAVVVASSALPTGAATAAKQPALGTAGAASADVVTVQGIASMTPLSVSAGSLPLPAGAATEATLAAASAKLPAALGQTTSPNSLSVVLASDQSAIPVTQASVVSTNNSSTATLAGGGVFTGTADNVANFAAIEITVFSNVASASNGLSLQQSSDGTNWDITDTYTIPAATGKTFSLGPSARFFRVVYTNGASAQASFRLQVVYHYAAPKDSTHSLNETMTLENDATLTITEMRAVNGTALTPLTTTSGGALSSNIVNINGVAVLAGNGTTGTGSQRVTIASDNTPIPTKSPVNTTGSGSAAGATVSTVQTLTAPANAVGFILMNLDTSTANIRWAVGRTASTTLGQQLQPGRDTGFVPVGANVSVIAESGTQNYDIQWVSQ